MTNLHWKLKLRRVDSLHIQLFKYSYHRRGIHCTQYSRLNLTGKKIVVNATIILKNAAFSWILYIARYVNLKVHRVLYNEIYIKIVKEKVGWDFVCRINLTSMIRMSILLMMIGIKRKWWFIGIIIDITLIYIEVGGQYK